MFLFKGKTKVAGLVGVSIYSDKVAIAHIVRDSDSQPKLHACLFKPYREPKAIPSTLAKMVAELGLEGAHCALVLKPQDYQLIVQDAPALEALLPFCRS